MKFKLLLFAATLTVMSCSGDKFKHDAAGVFEADEVFVSSEEGGKLQQFSINEGDSLSKDSVVAIVDALPISLQQQQVEASVNALGEKTLDAKPQLKLLEDQRAVLQAQLNNLQKEKQRIQNLIKADAATPKQLDDINFQIESASKQIIVSNQQVAVLKNNVQTQNRAILSEAKPLQIQISRLADKLNRTKVVNPITGSVLEKYAMEGEVVAPGKPLYKIADISSLNLRAYITGDQLSQVKLKQSVKVFVDAGAKNYKEYSGSVVWISNKAEFTPKTIQTKDERANLVYAVKVNVKNDGSLKIGMYGEINF